MNCPIALDIHAHLIPVIRERLDGMEDVAWDQDAGRMVIDGHTAGIASIYSPEALLEWMARERIAHAWVSAPPPTYRQHLQGSAARRWVDYLNSGMRDFADGSGGHLTALPHLPTQAPDIAAEIARAEIAKGARVFSMPTGTGDQRTLSDPDFAPLWSALDEAAATIFFHPGACADGRLRAFYLGNLLGNPHESAVAISHLILGGVLQRHPQITPCFAHGGGTYPMVADRVQRGFDTARPGIETGAPAPQGMLSRIVVDCICHGRGALDLAEATFGESNVVFGSDWPFPMGLIKPQEQLAGLYPAQRDRILGTNGHALMTKTSEEN